MGSQCLAKAAFPLQVHNGTQGGLGKPLLHHCVMAIISHENQYLTFSDDFTSKVKCVFHSSLLQTLKINSIPGARYNN